MKKIIIGDSGLDLNPGLREKLNIILVPFFINIGEKMYHDDGKLIIKNYLKEMKESKHVPKTAAPTPESIFNAMKDYDEAFIITISSELSTTYNNALIAKEMMQEHNPNAKVHVFDSKSAVAGETAIAIKIQECIEQNMEFEDIVRTVDKYVNSIKTFFILENLDNLVKNGRMSKIAGKIASALSINPICAGVNGKIEVLHKVRGMKSAINKLVSIIGTESNSLADKVLVISHINCIQRALDIKNKIKELYKFKTIEITEAGGLSSTYANDGGIVIAF